MCFDLGQLQEYFDGESTIEQTREINAHLITCHRCRERLEEIRQAALLVNSKLDAWMEPETRGPEERETVWELISRRAQREERVMEDRLPRDMRYRIKNTLGAITGREVKNMLKRYRAVATVAAVFLVCGIALSFGPVRGAAANFLAIFRADQLKTVTLSIDDLQNIERALQTGGQNIDLEQFGRVEVKENIKYVSSTLEEAAQKVDFTIKQPGKLSGYKQPKVRYTTPASASMTLKVDNVNKLLQSLKSESLLPQELDQKTFTLSIPASVAMTCESTDNQRPVTIVQSRSPEIGVPDGVDIGSVREALLGLPILPDELRRQLSAIGDWQHTMIIPDVNGSSKNVTVQGVPGVLMQDPDQGASPNSQKCLIWIKDGIIFAVEGPITSEQALEVANSLH
ncbi:MAG: hypothetical protein HPY50_19305 [Firmicutes bacterium]|nr:hypothetical protein [Bacillota bacterium]